VSAILFIRIAILLITFCLTFLELCFARTFHAVNSGISTFRIDDHIRLTLIDTVSFMVDLQSNHGFIHKADPSTAEESLRCRHAWTSFLA
jgi:hypothetical protein